MTLATSYAAYFGGTWPAEDQVLSGNTYTDGVTVFNGSHVEDLPAVEDVRNGKVYDNGNLTGVLVLPAVADVRLNVGYGANGTEFYGTLDVAAGGSPSVDDVRLGVVYGDANQFVGTVRVPPPDKVQEGYQYDANDSVTGTLDASSGGIGGDRDWIGR